MSKDLFSYTPELYTSLAPRHDCRIEKPMKSPSWICDGKKKRWIANYADFKLKSLIPFLAQMLSLLTKPAPAKAGGDVLEYKVVFLSQTSIELYT